MSSEPSNRRDASAIATRAALLRAARSAFGTQGYASVSLAQIVSDASATTGALYHHFADKKALFIAVAEEIEAEILASVVRTLPETGDLWAVVTYAVTETLALAARPGIASVIFRDAPNVIGAAAWREIEMRYGYGHLHALLRRLADAGRLAGYDPAIVAGIILGASIQTADATLASSHPEETLRAGQAAMVALLSGFKSEPGQLPSAGGAC
jgi:AcrR family transcriptional regulator